MSNFILNILVSLKLLVSKEEEEQQQQQAQDSENPFLDPLFSRIKKATQWNTGSYFLSWNLMPLFLFAGTTIAARHVWREQQLFEVRKGRRDRKKERQIDTKFRTRYVSGNCFVVDEWQTGFPGH
jgi:hypothetical protein